MNQMAGNEVNVLKLSLDGKSIGYLAGYQNGRNVLSFTEEFKQDINRPTFSLTTHPKFPYSEKLLAEPWVKNQRLHPSLSNLLPEGSLRVFIAQWLKVHVDNEFQLISYLGKDLPGALVFEKYNSANYEQISRIIYNYSGDGLADVQQFARRLLVNILLANGDAHLKNWSLIYTDKITPRFSPAYDLVTTSVYIPNESGFALNLGKNKHWQEASFKHFEAWANQSGVAWQSIKPHLKDVLEKAKDLWPKALKTLPMNQQHKLQLQEHWAKLHQDFRL